jgi:hypothetical protein
MPPKRAPVACGCQGFFLLSEVQGIRGSARKLVRPAESQGWLSGSQLPGGGKLGIAWGVARAGAGAGAVGCWLVGRVVPGEFCLVSGRALGFWDSTADGELGAKPGGPWMGWGFQGYPKPGSRRGRGIELGVIKRQTRFCGTRFEDHRARSKASADRFIRATARSMPARKSVEGSRIARANYALGAGLRCPPSFAVPEVRTIVAYDA